MHWSTPACGVPQSRLMSLVEAVANVVVGYGVAVVTQLLVSRRSGCTPRWARTSPSA
jgi:hypothetical protein